MKKYAPGNDMKQKCGWRAGATPWRCASSLPTYLKMSEIGAKEDMRE